MFGVRVPRWHAHKDPHLPGVHATDQRLLLRGAGFAPRLAPGFPARAPDFFFADFADFADLVASVEALCRFLRASTACSCWRWATEAWREEFSPRPRTTPMNSSITGSAGSSPAGANQAMPMLVVWGTDDVVIPSKHAENGPRPMPSA